MENQKAQGTIEYLVIIAIVVVIALVVVGLLLQVMNQGSGVPESTAKTAWKSAEPWAIVDWDVNTTGVTLILKNNSFESLDLVDVNLTSSKAWAVGKSNIAPGATVTIPIADAVTCAVANAGNRYAFPKTAIGFDYNTQTIAYKRQTASADIVGTC